MADAYSAKSLARGKLPAVKTALYTVPVGKKAIIKSLTLVNISGATRTVNLYIEDEWITPFDFQLGATYRTLDDAVHPMGAGEAVQGDADVADSVSYHIDGVELSSGSAGGGGNQIKQGNGDPNGVTYPDDLNAAGFYQDLDPGGVVWWWIVADQNWI